jgi:malonate transporter and related proteins
MQALINIIFPVFALIAVGIVAAKLGVFGSPNLVSTTVGSLTNATFVLFMSPLLFRSMATVDLHALSVAPLITYFGCALALGLSIVLVGYWRGVDIGVCTVRAIAVCFSNTTMLGIPIVQLSYGNAGLTILLMIVALHALILITVASFAIEFSQSAKQGSAGQGYQSVIYRALKSAIIHPVVLPILLGLAWGLTQWHLPAPIDAALALLGQAGPPASLVLLGASLLAYGIRGNLSASLLMAMGKVLVLPALIFLVGRYWVGLNALPLSVVTITAALPAGANVYLLAQRYGLVVGEASATIALSTILAVVTLSSLLPLLTRL